MFPIGCLLRHVYHQQPTKEYCGTHLVMLRIPDEKKPMKDLDLRAIYIFHRK